MIPSARRLAAVLFLGAGFLAAAGTDPAALLARVREAIGPAPSSAATGVHLRLEVSEVFHPGVTAVFEGHSYRAGERLRDLYLQHGTLVSSASWDGKTLLFGESTRLRHPMAADVIAYRRLARLERLLTLDADLSAATVTAPSDRRLAVVWPDDPLTYFLDLNPRTFVPRACQVELPSLYAGDLEHDTARIDVLEWSTTAHRFPLRLNYTYPESSVRVRVIDRQPWTPPPGDDFSLDAMRRAIASYRPLAADADPVNAARRRAIAELLDRQLRSDLTGPAAKLVRLGDPELYRAAILGGSVTVIVAPNRLDAHVGGTYYPLDIDLQNQPRLDVFTVRREPTSPQADELTFLHETTHLILRRHQTIEPILAPDDEDLAAYQEDMAYTIATLAVFDTVAGRQPHGEAWSREATRRWQHVVFRYRHSLVSHQLTEPQLVQFERLTGCHVRLDEIRQAYLDAGIPTAVLDAPLNPRYQAALDAEARKQRQLRARYGLPVPPAPEP